MWRNMTKGKKCCHEANICFDCQNAVPNAETGRGCPWSERFEPVPGWTAELTTVNRNWNSSPTYAITDCPLFIPDERSVDRYGRITE